MEGILRILRSGVCWQNLPDEFPHPSTCWRRLRDWEKQGVWLKVWGAFLSELNERQQLKWSESFLDSSFAPAKDGAPMRERLARRGIELLAPRHKNRTRPPTRDGRVLRRYKRCWAVERTIGWLGNYWRLVVRYDRSLTIYRAFFHIACFMIVLRSVL